MGGLYLILHKVRGELAFDVAQRHFGTQSLSVGYKTLPQSFEHVTGSVWHALPDHYSSATQRKGSLAWLTSAVWALSEGK
jgi:hypothetical protein